MKTSHRFAVLLVIATLIAALSACGDKPPALPSDTGPASIHQLVTGQHGEQFLRDISNHPWGDESQRAADLFNWIARDATASDPEARMLAAETAHALAVFLADNAGEFTGDDGEEKRGTIGSVNPGLTAAYTDALIPYLSAMVGDDTAGPAFEPLDPLESRLPRTSALFGVLNTHGAAGQQLADAVATLATGYEEEVAESVAADPTSVAADDTNLLRAARILGLAKSSNLPPSKTGATFQPLDAVTDLRYQIADRTIRGPNIDVPQQYFNGDGSLMAPHEVRDKFGEVGWDDYSSKLTSYLAKAPTINGVVDAFRDTYSIVADSRPDR